MSTRRLAAILSVLLVSGVLSLLGLEASYRLYLFGWDALSIAKVNSVNKLGPAGVIQPSPYSEIIYEFRPNLESHFKLVPLNTNSQGLRDNEYSIAKPDRTFRVAVIGDSFTIPAGVRIEEAYHTRLETRLNQERSDVSYEFINFGLGGYSLRQYLGVLKHKAMSYDPDLILIGFCAANDHEIPSEKKFHRPYRVKPKTHPFFTHSFALEQFVKQLSRYFEAREKARTKAEKRKTGKGKGKEQKRTKAAYSKEEVRYMSSMFSLITAIGRENDIPIVVVFLSHRYGEKRFRQAAELREIVRDHGLLFVDTTPAFEATDFDDYTIYAIDKHPNGKANQLFADRVYAYLRERKLLEPRQP